MYWLLGSSVQKIALQDGERSSSPTCKHMRVGVESGVVDSIPMLEQRHSYVMEKIFYGRCFHHSPAAEDSCLEALTSRLARWTKPLRTSLPLSTLTDLGRSKSALLAENALLRQQLIVLKATGETANIHQDRSHPPRPAGQAGSIVATGSLHRATRHPAALTSGLFRLYWKRRSKTSSHKPKVAAETIALIRQMATQNRLWGLNRSVVNC